MFGRSFFIVETVQQGTEVLDFLAEREHSHFLVTKSPLQILELAENFAELALHRKRALGALFTPCDRYIVEAFSGLRQEERIGILQSQTPRSVRPGHDIAIPKLWKNDLQRFSEAVENADGVLQWHDGSRGRCAVRGFVEDEGELGLRVLGVNQKSGATIDIAAQQPEAFVGGVPGLDHNVVQFVTQEVFDNTLKARLHFKKVGKHTDRGEAALHYSRLKKAADRLSGISVLSNH